MNLSECPHCYALVMFRPDGTCPACGKNPADAPEANLQYSAVEITEGQDLPSCCVLCGTETEQTELFEYHYDSHLGGRLDENSYFAFMIFTVLTLGVGLAFLPLYRKRLRKYRQLTYHIMLPYCESCLPEKPAYRPITIEGRAFHFKVHKSFKEKMKAMEKEVHL
ncbi:MAG: hypothetical protein HYS18_08060 [Burkholderiales bacterium]|nr:hypothetical protein [Burkholderiales bacterium]